MDRSIHTLQKPWLRRLTPSCAGAGTVEPLSCWNCMNPMLTSLTSKRAESIPDGYREAPMPIELNHAIVPARDREASAQFMARILGLRIEGELGPFIVVRVNERLTFDVRHADRFEHHHYAFKVGDDDFDKIFERIRAEGIAYGGGPHAPDDMKINHLRGGRGFYFRDPNGHMLEILTA